MKMYWKKIRRMASLTLAGVSVAVILFLGGCASDTSQQSPSRPTREMPGGGGGGGG
jgi:hypothetical protein